MDLEKTVSRLRRRRDAALESLDENARKMVSEDRTLSHEVAFARALLADPDLYETYRNAQSALAALGTL